MLAPLAVALVNHKGGVGKTTIAHVLAQIAAQRGMTVTAYDLDEQRNLTDSLSLVDFPNLKIKARIKEGDENDGTDLYILDCPPALSFTTDEAISFADIIIMPVPPSLYSISNLDVLFTRIEDHGKGREQVAIVKNCFDDSRLSRELDDFLTGKGYPVAGRLPLSRRLRGNLSSGLIWNHAMREKERAPFVSLLDSVLRAFEMLSAGKLSAAWEGEKENAGNED